MEKIKENVLQDFKQMIYNSWTYNKMTIEERKRLEEVFNHIRTVSALKGTYSQRWETLQAIYHTFLLGIGYNSWNWREEEKEVTF